MSAVGVVGILMAEYSLTAQGIDEGCPTYKVSLLANEGIVRAFWVWSGLTSTRGSTDHQAELDSLLHVLLPSNHLLRAVGRHVSSVLERRNWMLSRRPIT